MSHDLAVVSTAPVDHNAIVEAMARRGWGVRFSDEGVLGWCTAWAAVPSHGAADLPYTHYALVGFSERPAGQDWVEELVGKHARFADRLRLAAHVAVISTRAGRRPLAHALQQALWQAIGEATGGLLYDEVSGALVSEIATVATPAGPEVPLGVGMEAPRLELARQDGKLFTLADYRGQPVTLWFIPSGLQTPFAESEGASLAAVQEAVKKLTVLVALGPFSGADFREYAARFGLRFPLLGDATTAVGEYDCYQERLTVIVGPDGMIRDQYQRKGYGELAGRELLNRLLELQKKGGLW